MLNLFKKNTNGTEKNQGKETRNLNAKEALQVSSQKWKTLPDQKIFEKIFERAKYGFREAYFTTSYITGAQVMMLRELGYEVYVATPKESAPYFKVSW